MTWELLHEDPFYKEETTWVDAYWLRGVYYESQETSTYKTIYGTDEPYKDGQEAVMLPSGTSSSDARILHSSEILLTYDSTGDLSTADVVYLKDPETTRNKPQGYVVMAKEDWHVNEGFTLIGNDQANIYLLVKKEKVVNNGG